MDPKPEPDREKSMQAYLRCVMEIEKLTQRIKVLQAECRRLQPSIVTYVKPRKPLRFEVKTDNGHMNGKLSLKRIVTRESVTKKRLAQWLVQHVEKNGPLGTGDIQPTLDQIWKDRKVTSVRQRVMPAFSQN